MKARILSMLVVVALLITATVLMTSATTPPDYTAALTEGECPDCGDATWTALTGAEGTLGAGHYCLTGDLTANLVFETTGTVCLHLDGKALTGDISVTGGTFSLMGNGTVNGQITAANSTVYMRSGTVNGVDDQSGGAFNVSNTALYVTGGTVNGGFASIKETTKHGGAIYAVGGSIEIKNATVQNGAAQNGGNIWADGTQITIGSGAMISGGHAAYGGKGGNIYANGTSTINMSAGTITNGTAQGGTFRTIAGTTRSVHASNGGNIALDGGADLTITGGTVENATSNYGGGNIWSTTGSEISISGATVSGGVTKTGSGGNLSVTSATITIGSGATVTNGKTATASKNGGNIYAATSTITMTGGTVSSGRATSNGGNIYADTTEVTISNATVSGGIAGNVGGNMYVKGEPVTINAGADIYGGDATTYGGNIFATTSATITMNDGDVYNGEATDGGNFYVTGGATFTMNGGTVSSGEASNSGGNIFSTGSAKININSGAEISDGVATATAGGNIWAESSSVINMTGGEVKGGTSDKYNQHNIRLNTGAVMNMTGGVVYGKDGCDAANVGTAITSNASTLRLGGNARIVREDGVKDGLVRLIGGKLHILTDWTGEAGFEFNAFSPEYGYEFADVQCGTLSAEGVFTKGCDQNFAGNLYYQAMEGEPAIYAVSGGTMYISGLQMVKTNGATEWVRGNSVATTAADKYVKYYGGALALSGDAVVDFNGKEATVTGSGKLYGFDSANDTYDAELCGTVTLASTDVDPQLSTYAAGKNYVAIFGENDTVSYHCVAMKVINVALRPSAVGYYYQAQYIFDDVVAGKVDCYGIAVSKDKLPGADFADYAAYTVMTDELVSGATTNSGLLANIMKAGEATNTVRGEIVVYANPYLAVKSSDEAVAVVVGDPENAGEKAGFGMSLKDVLVTIDDYWTNLGKTTKDDLRDFYGDWATEGMSAWATDLPNMSAPAEA